MYDPRYTYFTWLPTIRRERKGRISRKKRKKYRGKTLKKKRMRRKKEESRFLPNCGLHQRAAQWALLIKNLIAADLHPPLKTNIYFRGANYAWPLIGFLIFPRKGSLSSRAHPVGLRACSYFTCRTLIVPVNSFFLGKERKGR